MFSLVYSCFIYLLLGAQVRSARQARTGIRGVPSAHPRRDAGHGVRAPLPHHQDAVPRVSPKREGVIGH